MGVELHTVRFVAADRYEVVFTTGSGQLVVPCRVEVRAGTVRVAPADGWPAGTDSVLLERTVLAVARTRGSAAGQDERGASVTDPQHPVRRAIEAARHGDLALLRSLIDWPLSVLPSFGSGLDGLDDRSRAWAIGAGMAEFDAARTDRSVADGPLHGLSVRLAGALQVRTAAPADRQEALLRLRPPEVPVTLPATVRDRLRELAGRAALVGEVVVASDARGTIPLAVAPDTGLLVVLA